MGQVEGSDARRAAPRRFGRAKCGNCLQPFTKKKPWQRFCKPKCRDGYHNDNRKLEKLDETDV